MMMSRHSSVWGQCVLARACTSQREEAFIEAVDEEVIVDEVMEEVGDGVEDDLEVEARRGRGKKPR